MRQSQSLTYMRAPSTHGVSKIAAAMCGLAAIVMMSGCKTGPKHAAGPKKVLVVTVTKGFRHSSIATAERVLGQLAEKSGLFTVDYARVEPTDPQFKGDDGKPDGK